MEMSLMVMVALAAAVLFLLISNIWLAWRLKQALRDVMHDGLTGLLNRSGFEAFAEQQMSLVGRNHGYEATLVYIDLNNFKPVNDHYGHRVGDEFLRKFAGLLRTCFRGSDIIGRVGGDEFAVFLPRTNTLGAARLVEKLNATMRATHFVVGEYPLDVDAAIGYVEASKGVSLLALIEEADAQMYKAKRAGKAITLEPTAQST